MAEEATPRRELSPEHSKSLMSITSRRISESLGDEPDEDHAHGHHEKPQSILTAIASAVINFLLMFGLCCAYGMIMFEDDWNERHRGLGVKMNLATALIVGLLLSGFSKIPVAIGGPDLNPVVFLSLFVRSISESLANQHGLALPGGGRRLLDDCVEALQNLDASELIRRLGGGYGEKVEWCVGDHYASHASQCDKYHDELRATTVFSVAVSSLLLGLIYICLGKFKLTRFVSYVPTNIMEAFLSCVGYKVFKYALKFCKYKPQMFIPAACIGVPMYFMKALHLGNPAIVIPIVLLVPLGIFYAIVFGTGGDLDSAREAGWMFDPPIKNFGFWVIWSDSIGKPWNINFEAWASTLIDLPIMLVVVVLDCMLKLSSTENKLPVKAHKDYEIQLFGAGNLLTTLFGSSVGYMQLKFNVINYGVMGNATDRRGGVIYALLCGLCYFWTTDLFTFLPRFFLSTLLFFAGAGFVAENLWGSRKYLSIWEWLQIFVILAVFIFMNSLLMAVIAGGLITGVAFILRYAKIPCISGRPMKGHEVSSSERRDLLVQKKIQHIARDWLMVIKLKGFIFFASAQKLTGWVTNHLEAEQKEGLPKHRRLHWIIFDCSQLDGLDSSASKAFSKLVKAAKGMHVEIIWTCLSESFVHQLKTCDTITSDRQWYQHHDNALQYCEGRVLSFARKVQERWVELHPMFGLTYDMMKARSAYEPFQDIFELDATRTGCPWRYCSRMEIKAGVTVLWRPGELCREIFLVHTGTVGLFKRIPSGTESDTDCGSPVAVYGRGWFLNREGLLRQPALHYGVALEDGEVLYWTEVDWAKMSREHPAMAAAIMRAVIKQQKSDATRQGACEDELQAGGPAAEEVLEEDEPEEHCEGKAPGNDEHPAAAQVDAEDKAGAAASAGENAATAAASAGENAAAASGAKQEMQRWVQESDIAIAIGKAGYYSPPGASEKAVLPQVPECMLQDLRLAFATYAESQTSISLDVASQALMYAGIFNAVFEGEAGKQEFTEAEFVVLANQAAMTKLGEAQVEKLAGLFKRYQDKDEKVDQGSLGKMFQEAFHPAITVEEVDGVADLWTKSQATRAIVLHDFVAIASRFFRKYEQDWCVLQGVRELLGKDLNVGDVLTPQTLTDATAGTAVSQQEAEEMLWCAGGGTNEGDALDVRLVAAALTPIGVPPARLPPKPVRQQSTVMLMTPRPSNVLVDNRGLDGSEVARVRSSANNVNWVAGQIGEDEAARQQAEEEKAEEEPEEEKKSCRARLHLFLDYPESSNVASNWSVFMGIMIMISVLTLFLEPLVSPKTKPMSQIEKDLWLAFEAFFTIIFTIEFIARFSVANALGTMRTIDFLKKPMNICDIVAILPFYIDQTIDVDNEEFRLFRISRLMRLSRLVRLGRLAKRSATFAPIAMILVVIWGIYMQNGLKEGTA